MNAPTLPELQPQLLSIPPCKRSSQHNFESLFLFYVLYVKEISIRIINHQEKVMMMRHHHEGTNDKRYPPAALFPPRNERRRRVALWLDPRCRAVPRQIPWAPTRPWPSSSSSSLSSCFFRHGKKISRLVAVLVFVAPLCLRRSRCSSAFALEVDSSVNSLKIVSLSATHSSAICFFFQKKYYQIKI